MFLKGGINMVPVSLAMTEIAISIVVFLICGYVLGYFLGKNKRKPIGTLRVDSSDPDGPYFFLELATNPNVIKKEKYVLLKVDTRSYISQK